MNRTLILIIADFLLLSLLALARFEPSPKESRQSQQMTEEARQEQLTQTEQEDLLEILQMTLDEERKSRSKVKETLKEKEKALNQKQKALEEKKKRAEKLAEEKAQLEKQRNELQKTAKEKEKIESEYKQTRQKLQQAQQARAELSESLTEAKTSSVTAQQREKMLESELQERKEELQQIQKQLEETQSGKKVAELQKQRMETELKVKETEKAMLRETLELSKDQLETAQKEKKQLRETAQKLATNVGDLAQSQSRISDEIKEMQPMSFNQIHELFSMNRMLVTLSMQKTGLIGTSSSSQQLQTVPVELPDGNPYLLVHREEAGLDTPSLITLDITLSRADGQTYQPSSIKFLKEDPRILAIPVPQKAIEGNVLDAFPLSENPLRFPKAVAIGPGDRFGEVLMKQHRQRLNYFKRDSKLFTNAPGEVTARQGFHVFDKTGRFMGLMINSRYTMHLEEGDTLDTLNVGDNFSPNQWKKTHQTIDRRLKKLPSELR